MSDERQQASVQCPCGRQHTLDVTPEGEHDPRGPLVILATGWGGLPGGTLTRWARRGRLRAFRAERGKLVAWERDVRDAVEVEPVTTSTGDAGLDALLNDPNLMVSG